MNIKQLLAYPTYTSNEVKKLNLSESEKNNARFTCVALSISTGGIYLLGALVARVYREIKENIQNKEIEKTNNLATKELGTDSVKADKFLKIPDKNTLSKDNYNSWISYRDTYEAIENKHLELRNGNIQPASVNNQINIDSLKSAIASLNGFFKSESDKAFVLSLSNKLPKNAHNENINEIYQILIQINSVINNQINQTTNPTNIVLVEIKPTADIPNPPSDNAFDATYTEEFQLIDETPDAATAFDATFDDTLDASFVGEPPQTNDNVKGKALETRLRGFISKINESKTPKDLIQNINTLRDSNTIYSLQKLCKFSNSADFEELFKKLEAFDLPEHSKVLRNLVQLWGFINKGEIMISETTLAEFTANIQLIIPKNHPNRAECMRHLNLMKSNVDNFDLQGYAKDLEQVQNIFFNDLMNKLKLMK